MARVCQTPLLSTVSSSQTIDTRAHYIVRAGDEFQVQAGATSEDMQIKTSVSKRAHSKVRTVVERDGLNRLKPKSIDTLFKLLDMPNVAAAEDKARRVIGQLAELIRRERQSKGVQLGSSPGGEVMPRSLRR